MKLNELERRYEELGREIEKLKVASPSTTYVQFKHVPNGLHVHVAARQMTWHEAMDYAESIGMRLAKLPELQMIAASTDEFNHLGWCWSSSTRSNYTTGAWSVYLSNGNTGNYNKSNTRSVLCLGPCPGNQN